MNYPTIRFVFDRKHHASRTSKGLVQIEVLFQRRRKWIGTGVHLFKHQWDEKRHVVNSPTVIEDNETLDVIMQKVKQIVHGIIRDTGSFSFALFNQKIERGRNRESFVQFVERIAARGDRSDSRRQQYVAVAVRVRDFGKLDSFDDLTVERISEFNDFLSDAGLSSSTIHNYHAILRAIINDAIKASYVVYNPYSDYEIPKAINKPRDYLTMEELERFKAVEVSDRMIESRDFFIVQCYTGLSLSDLKKLTRDCTEKRGDKTVLLGRRIKTGVDYYIVLIKPVLDILEKYDYHIPIKSLPTLNTHLRKIARDADIKKTVSSHVGRHTFAVIALYNGIGIETVAKILGHTDIKTTQIYAKIVDKGVEESFEELEIAVES